MRLRKSEPVVVSIKLRKDYVIPVDAVLFMGDTQLGEVVCFFVDPKGGALGFVYADGEPDEWHFEAGTFDPSTKSLFVKAGVDL